MAIPANGIRSLIWVLPLWWVCPASAGTGQPTPDGDVAKGFFDRLSGGQPFRRHAASDVCFSTAGASTWEFRGAEPFAEGTSATWTYTKHDEHRHLTVTVLPRPRGKAEDIAAALVQALPKGEVYRTFPLGVPSLPDGAWAAGLARLPTATFYPDLKRRPVLVRELDPSVLMGDEQTLVVGVVAYTYLLDEHVVSGVYTTSRQEGHPGDWYADIIGWSAMPCQDIRKQAANQTIVDLLQPLPNPNDGGSSPPQ